MRSNRLYRKFLESKYDIEIKWCKLTKEWIVYRYEKNVLYEFCEEKIIFKGKTLIEVKNNMEIINKKG